MVNVAALRDRRHHDCRDTAARTELVAPTRSCWWRNMIPEASILVIGYYDDHSLPLRAFVKPFEKLSNMDVAADDIGK